MDELDNLLKRLMNRHAEAMPSEGDECISEELFSAYLDNSLAPEEKESVEKHLLLCETCFQKSIIFSRVMEKMGDTEQLEVPHDLKEKTRRLAREMSTQDIAEIVLEFGKDIVKIIKDSAGICTLPEPVMLNARISGSEVSRNPVADISTTFFAIRADISIEKINERELEIEVRISHAASGKPLNDIRVNLLSGGKELASFLTERGSVRFQKLAFDKYVVKMYKEKDLIGSVPVTLASSK